MCCHRRRHLPQRVGEDIRQHQVERPARRELRRGKSGGVDRLDQVADAIEPRIVARNAHADRIDVARQHPLAQRLGRGDGKHAGARP